MKEAPRNDISLNATFYLNDKYMLYNKPEKRLPLDKIVDEAIDTLKETPEPIIL